MSLSPQVIIPDKPPRPIQATLDDIPPELRRRPQWINWKYARDKKGKWTKHPYNPRTGRKASSTDLMSWSTFEEALDAYQAGKYDGVGFMFSSGDPYSGVDLDGCRNPETGDIERWAIEVIKGLDSYTELSPSGTGIHVIVKGKVPAPLKRGRIEMYSTERYFTMTGCVMELPA